MLHRCSHMVLCAANCRISKCISLFLFSTISLLVFFFVLNLMKMGRQTSWKKSIEPCCYCTQRNQFKFDARKPKTNEICMCSALVCVRTQFTQYILFKSKIHSIWCEFISIRNYFIAYGIDCIV